jgi:hypothetical protein
VVEWVADTVRLTQPFLLPPSRTNEEAIDDTTANALSQVLIHDDYATPTLGPLDDALLERSSQYDLLRAGVDG